MPTSFEEGDKVIFDTTTNTIVEGPYTTETWADDTLQNAKVTHGSNVAMAEYCNGNFIVSNGVSAQALELTETE
jgi:hypothetical protein